LPQELIVKKAVFSTRGISSGLTLEDRDTGGFWVVETIVNTETGG